MLSFSFARASESKDLLLPARATSSFTTVAGQGWLVGLAEPALDAETTLAYRRVGRQDGIGNSDRDGLFEQEIGAQEHDRSSSGPRKAVSRFACLRAGTLGPQGCAPWALAHGSVPAVVRARGTAWRALMMDRARTHLLAYAKDSLISAVPHRRAARQPNDAREGQATNEGGCVIMLNGTMILELLHQKPGRYIQRDMGLYRMKEADGADVLHTEKSGRESPVEPLAAPMDGLMNEGRLVRDGSRYSLPFT